MTTITPNALRLPHAQADDMTGCDVLHGLLTLACDAFSAVRSDSALTRFALSGRIRGTGPGASFSAMIATLERDHPLDLVFPFEGSDHVGGACWLADELLDGEHAGCSIAKLHWKAGARDLPIHAHTRSDRFIIVLDGRGFYHVSPHTLPEFDGTDVRTIAARSGDVFMFSRDVVHTFSTAEQGMTLISCHLPHIPFEDPSQYTLPGMRWTALESLHGEPAGAIALGGWSVLA